MKKTWIIGLLTLALLLAGAAFADQEDAPVLLVQLPEDAQMVETSPLTMAISFRPINSAAAHTCSCCAICSLM